MKNNNGNKFNLETVVHTQIDELMRDSNLVYEGCDVTEMRSVTCFLLNYHYTPNLLEWHWQIWGRDMPRDRPMK